MKVVQKKQKKRVAIPANPPSIILNPWLDVVVRLPFTAPPLTTVLATTIATRLFAQSGLPAPTDWRMRILSVTMWGAVSGSAPISLAVYRLGSGAANDPVAVRQAYGNPLRRAVVHYKLDPQATVVQLTLSGNESVFELRSTGDCVVDVHILFRPLSAPQALFDL